jgi:hypothetical protein
LSAGLLRLLFTDREDVALSCHRSFQTFGLIVSFVCSSNVGVSGLASSSSANYTDILSTTSLVDSSALRQQSTWRWPPSAATKIYIQAVLLAGSLVLYAAAEYTLPRRSRLMNAVCGGNKLQRRVAMEIASETSYTTKRQRRIKSVDDINLIVFSSSVEQPGNHRCHEAAANNNTYYRFDV